MLIDSHCHLDYFTPAELPAVLARAAAAGVGEMVTIGTTLDAIRRACRRWPRRTPNLWCTVGVHPHHAAEAPIPAPETLAAMTRHPKVIGIGESGLDYFYDRSPRDVQGENFRAHIRAARLAGVPLAIHARDADDDIAAILQDERDTGGDFAFLLHCFSSSRRLAEAAHRTRRLYQLLRHPDLPEIQRTPRYRARRSSGSAAGGDRRPLPRPGPAPRQAQRAGLCRPYRPRAGGGPRHDRRRPWPTSPRRTSAACSPRPPETAAMRITLLGTGGSAGVPLIGGADGAGDWGACDPTEPRNRAHPRQHRGRKRGGDPSAGGHRPGHARAASGLPHPAGGRGALHPPACRPHHRHRRGPHPQPPGRTGRWTPSPPAPRWTR